MILLRADVDMSNDSMTYPLQTVMSTVRTVNLVIRKKMICNGFAILRMAHTVCTHLHSPRAVSRAYRALSF